MKTGSGGICHMFHNYIYFHHFDIIIITVLFSAQCGGRKLSARTRHYCCYFSVWMVLRAINSHSLWPPRKCYIFAKGLLLWCPCFGLASGNVLQFFSMASIVKFEITVLARSLQYAKDASGESFLYIYPALFVSRMYTHFRHLFMLL